MVIEKDDKLILLTNDDGLYAAGLRTLLEVMEEFGKVVLISTLESQSGPYSQNAAQGQAS
jgi:5'-nucleotidase